MNSLKSIYSRITTMDKSEDILKAAGVSMRNLNGETRDVSDIMDELASKWNGLSKETQQNTAVNLAGRYQLTRFLALMQNYNISLSATETALNSQGSATRENEKYMQSLEARIQKMKTAWETMSLAFGDAIISDTIITLTSLLASMLNGVAGVVDAVGALPVIFGLASVALLGLHMGFKMLIVEMTKTIASLFGITIQTGSASAGLRGLSLSTIASKISLMGMAGAANIAKVALRGLLVATGVGAAFAAIGWALEGIIGLFSSATQATEDFTDKTEALNEKKYDLANLKQLQEEYDTLSKKTSLNFDEKTKLAQIESELSSKYSITVQGIDGQTKAINENSEAIKAKLSLMEDEIAIVNKRAEVAYAANAKEIEGNIAKYKDEVSKLAERKKKAEEEYALRQKVLANTDPNDSYYDVNSRFAQRAAEALEAETKAYDEANTKLQENTNKKALILKNAGQEYIDEQERNNVKINGMTRKFLDIYATAAADSKIPADQLKNNLSKVFESVQSGNIKNAAQGMSILESLPGVANLTAESYRNMGAAISQVDYAPVVEGVENTEDAVDGLGDSANQTGQKVSDMSKKLDELSVWATNSKEEVELLNKAQSELAKKNTLSADTIKKMNEKYGDFIKITGLSKDSILKFIKAKKEEKTEFINAEIKKTEVAIEASMKRIATVELEMSARQKLINQMKEDYSDIAGKDPLEDIKTESRMGAVRSAGGKQADLTYEKEKLAELIATLQTWKSIGSDTKQMVENGDKAVQDATKSNDKSNQSYTDTNEILTETQKQFIKLADAIKKVQNERSTMVKGSKEYIASLEKEKKLTEDQIALAKEALKNPSELVSTKVKTTTTTSASDTSSGSSSSSSNSSSSSGSGTKLDTLLSNALGLQGKFTYKQVGGKFKGTYDQFVKGAISDCSQFVQEMFDEFLGINLPRTAAEQAKQGVAVQKADLQKGDLVFFNTTGKANSHVGIYTGNGKFVQMGNSGLKEQSLSSSYWSPKYQGARRINGVGESTSASTPSVNTNTTATKTTTTSSDGKVKTEVVKATQKEIDDAVRDLKLNLSAWTAEVYQQSLDIIDAYVTKTDNEIAKLQSKRELSSNKQSRFTQDSPEWRKEEMAQSSYLQQEQKLLEQQSKDIRQQLIEKKITKGEYDAKLAENSAKWWDYQSQIDEKRKSVFDSQLASYDKQVKADEDALAVSEANLKLMTEGTVEYNKELRSQIVILEHKGTVIAKEIEYTKSLLANNKQNAVMTAYYNDKLQELNLSLLGTNSALADVNKALKDLRESAADNIIDEYKKVIEQQRDLELEALDQLRDKEDKRHEEAMKNIDDEQKRFEDYISARLKAFDRENADVDYTEELQNKMDERQKVQDKLNTYAMDNTMEGKAKRKELEEQLAAIDEEIRKFQRDRERELIKQGLQDQLDDHKNYNDEIKDEEDKLHDDTLDKLDEEKKKTERKYKDILENQKYFYDLKQGLMSNDAIVVTATLGTIGREYDKLFATIKDHTFETSQAMQNMVYDFQKSMESLNKYSGGDYSAPNSGSSSGSNGGTSGSTGTIKGTTAARVAWTEYLSNKQSAESIKAEMAKLDKASTQYKNLTQQFDTLKAKNDQLRSVYGFPDGSFKDLVNQKIFSAKTGGMTPSDVPAEGQYILAHKKELILKESDTSNILKVVDVVRGITDKIKSGLNLAGLMPKASTSPTSNDNSVRIEKVEIYANDKDTGNSLLNKFSSALNSKMKARMI